VQPVGAQRGTTLEITLSGANLAEPTSFATSFPTKITFPSDNNNGKDKAKLRVLVEIPSDAPLGFHSVRLATARGISNLRLFCIDDLPQVAEKDGNHSQSTAQAVPVPCVVGGTADVELSDYFKFAVKAGQRLSFEVLGRRLGSFFDPQISLFDLRTGRELPGGHSNDAPGLQTDARLTYVFKEAGEYAIEIRDVMYRGGKDFPYRLRIGDFPCATTPIPMAARRGGQVRVHFAGTMLDGVAPVEVVVPADPGVNAVWVAPRGANGLYGWPVALALSNHEELVEQEPNNEPSRANRIPVPGGITGQFLERGDIDHFVFAAKKGQRCLIEAHTQELNSPTEVYMILKDAKGSQLATINPAAAPRIDFVAPADGDYTLSAEHLLYWSGPAESYRITVLPYEAGFDLAPALDRFDVPAGSPLGIPIYVVRRDYSGPIDVSVLGHPDITGNVTIPAGKPAAPNQPAGTLFVRTHPATPVGSYEIAIQGSATINGKTVIHSASQRAVISQSLAGLPYPPPQLFSKVAIAVTEKAPFALAARLNLSEGARGSPVPVTISAVRAAGFVEEIALTATGLPPNVATSVNSIPKGQNEVRLELRPTTSPPPAANVGLGQFSIVFTGKAKYGSRDVSVTAEPINLSMTLPFELRVDPMALQIAAGAKSKLKVSATRKGGYQGPISLEVLNLPVNITAAKASIAMGQTAAEIELTAAANATPLEMASVQVVGKTTAPGASQSHSATFKLSIPKKK
jgi:hypothetical protein